MFIEAAQMRLMAKGDEGGHVEGAAQVDVAVFADARFLLHRVARGMLARIRGGELQPLAVEAEFLPDRCSC